MTRCDIKGEVFELVYKGLINLDNRKLRKASHYCMCLSFFEVCDVIKSLVINHTLEIQCAIEKGNVFFKIEDGIGWFLEIFTPQFVLIKND